MLRTSDSADAVEDYEQDLSLLLSCHIMSAYVRWSLAMECLSEAHRRPRFVGAIPTLVDRVQQLRSYYVQSMDCLYPVPNVGNCTCPEHKCKKMESFDRE